MADTIVVSRHDVAEVILNRHTGQHSLHASRAFSAGDRISRFSAGEILDSPSYLTVQAGDKKHITLQPSFLQYVNHSCSPNAFFDTDNMELVALADIAPNEEITFFYPSTEYDMSQPFLCFCGSKNCLRNIRGARFLSDESKKNYRFSSYIRQLL